MPLEKCTTIKYKHSWGRTCWEVKPNELMDIGDTQFIKLPRVGLNHGFPRLCYEEPGVGAPKWLRDKDDFSLTKSVGYQRLLDSRNVAWAEQLNNEAVNAVPEMFRQSIAQAENKHIVKKTAEMKKTVKEHPQIVSVPIPAFGSCAERSVNMKVPVKDSEWLWVESDNGVLEHVMAFIRHAGIDWDMRVRDEQLPQGVHAIKSRSHPYQYVWKAADGKKSRHLASSLEGALVGVQEGPPNNADNAEAEPQHDDLPDGGDDIGE